METIALVILSIVLIWREWTRAPRPQPFSPGEAFDAAMAELIKTQRAAQDVQAESRP